MPQMDDIQVLTLKCYECAEPDINREDWAKDFLLKLVDYIGMTSLPHANWEHLLTHPTDLTLSGISASRGMAESDISLHTWSESKQVRVCITCCAAFDEDNAMSWVRATLRSHRVVRA